MPWVIFDEEDRRIPAPRFCLEALNPGQAGSRIGMDDYCEQCNLVLVFPRPGACEGCLNFLNSFRERMGDYARVEAQVLALLPGEAGELREAPDLELPFPLLADAGGEVRRAYAGLMAESLVNEASTLVFVLDTYGAPYSAFIGTEAEMQKPGLHDEVLSWLEYIGVQCPE